VARRRTVLAGSVLAMLVLAGCSGEEIRSRADEAGRGVAEGTARNVAAVAGAQAFRQAGVDVEGGLDCRATADQEVETVQVSCTGRSTAGQALRLTGDGRRPGANAKGVQGRFTGTAAGREVFRKDCLGTGC
jgi:hypothetical protein